MISHTSDTFIFTLLEVPTAMARARGAVREEKVKQICKPTPPAENSLLSF
jgi:hypothetical protein